VSFCGLRLFSVEVTVYGPLRAVTGSKTVEVTVNGDTVGTVIAAFVAAKIRHTVCQRSRVGALVSSMSDGVSPSSSSVWAPELSSSSDNCSSLRSGRGGIS